MRWTRVESRISTGRRRFNTTIYTTCTYNTLHTYTPQGVIDSYTNVWVRVVVRVSSRTVQRSNTEV